MGLYSFVHWLSLALAGVSLCALSVLISRQAVVNRRAARHAERRRQLQAVAMEYLEEPEFLPAFKAQLKPADQRLLARVFVELLPRLKGDYADKMVAMMRELGIMDRSLKALRSRKPWRRAEACAVLGFFPDRPVINALENALDDAEVIVRLEAARALARQNAVSSAAGLVARLGMADPIHSLAVRQIFRGLGRGAVTELIAILGSDVPDHVRVLTADALGHIGDSRAVPALLQQLDCGRMNEPAHGGTQFISRRRGFSDNPQPSRRSVAVQVAILQALARFPEPRVRAALGTALEDPVWEIRAQAAQCLGQLGTNESVPGLEQLLHDNHWWARFHAAEALFKLGRAGRAALVNATRGPSTRAAAIAADILREKGALPA